MLNRHAETAAEHLRQQEQSHRAEAEQALDDQKRSHFAEAEQAIQKALNKQ